MSQRKMDRQHWVAGSRLLVAVLQDDLAIAKALRARSYHDLHAAAVLARDGVSPDMAMTDPALYAALRRAITIFFLKGYRGLDIDKLERLSKSGMPTPLSRPAEA